MYKIPEQHVIIHVITEISTARRNTNKKSFNLKHLVEIQGTHMLTRIQRSNFSLHLGLLRPM